MRWIWVRHGETEANAERRYLGHRDSPLTERGWEQARLAAKTLAEKCGLASSPSGRRLRLYSSDLGRAAETARIIGQAIGAEPAADAALRELDFGDWDGLTYDEIMAADPERAKRWYDDPWATTPPGGENLAEFGARIDGWMKRMRLALGCGQSAWKALAPDARTEPADTIIVVTHGGPIRWLASKYVLGDERRFWEAETVPPGGMFETECLNGNFW